jgi:diguanylate cyclase (GGDEF)-like protein
MIKNIQNYYKSSLISLSKSDEEKLVSLLTGINIQRLRMIALLTVVIMFGMIFFDMALIGAVNIANAVSLRPYFIALRIVFIFGALIFLIVTRNDQQHEGLLKRYKLYIEVFVVFGLIFLSVFTGFVQAIRDDISPYLMGLFLVTSFIYLDRKQVNFILGAALITMGIGTWLVQEDKGVFWYNMLNACIMTLLAWIATHILYSNRAREFLNQQLIEKQALQMAESNEKLEEFSYRDPLTNLTNRRYFDENIQREWNKAIEEGKPISLIFIDIDHFKELNDTFGHQIGDECLKQIGSSLCSQTDMSEAIVARLGGDEYAVLLPNKDIKKAKAIANQMLQAVRALNNNFASQYGGKISISIGVACVQPSVEDSPSVLLCKADLALYKAKDMGRNQVAAL